MRAMASPVQLVLPVIMGGYIKHSGFLLPGNQPVRAEPAEAPHLRSVSKKIVANKSPAATSDLWLLIANLTFGLLNRASAVNLVQEITPVTNLLQTLDYQCATAWSKKQNRNC